MIVIYRHVLGHESARNILFQGIVSILWIFTFKSEGRRFETWWGEWIFSIYLILLAALDPGVYLASNTNEYQKQKNYLCGE
jgi:hypothetical protein